MVFAYPASWQERRQNSTNSKINAPMARYARSLPELPPDTPVFPKLAIARSEASRVRISNHPFPNKSPVRAVPLRPKKGHDGFALAQNAIVRCLPFNGKWHMDVSQSFSFALS
jgi:hypothetical protein